MSDFVYEEALIFNGQNPPLAVVGKIREHHPAHSHGLGRMIVGEIFGLKGRELKKVGGQAGGQQLTTTPFGTAPSTGSLLNPGPDIDFIEFRFPHTKKHEMRGQFRGDGTGISSFVLDKAVRLQNAAQATITFGKTNPYKAEHKILTGSEVSSQARGGADAGMTLGGSIAALVAATGASVATAGITLGVGLGVAVIAVSATAANNYRGRVRNKQVFLRVSRSPASGQLKAYFPYEEKIYWSQTVDVPNDVGGITFRRIWELMGQNG